MLDNIIRSPLTVEAPWTLKAMAEYTSKVEKYEKIEQIISEYKRQPSGNVFTNDKYFRRILEVFERETE